MILKCVFSKILLVFLTGREILCVESFPFGRVFRVDFSQSSRPLVVHRTSHGMNTCEPSKKPHSIDGFYDSSSGVGHGRGQACSAPFVGPHYSSHGALDGSSFKPS